jgi:hypothetical protein
MTLISRIIGIILFCALTIGSLYVAVQFIFGDPDFVTAFVGFGVIVVALSMGVFAIIQSANKNKVFISDSTPTKSPRTNWSVFSKIAAYFLYTIFVVVYSISAIGDYFRDPTGFADFKLIPVMFFLGLWFLVGLESLSMKLEIYRSQTILRFVLLFIASFSISIYLINLITR